MHIEESRANVAARYLQNPFEICIIAVERVYYPRLFYLPGKEGPRLSL